VDEEEMWINYDRMISLGYGRYVRSDDVSAVEPIEEGRGPRRRALVWLRGRATPMVASRSEESIIRDLTDDSDAAHKGSYQRLVLEHVAKSLDGVSGSVRRRLRERDGVDLDELVDEAHKAIA
jgi:hypothetical protein